MSKKYNQVFSDEQIGKKYFSELIDTGVFFDRSISCKTSFDVIIPALNTDMFFYRNLLSIYREIPVNRLLIGDGGCTDDTLSVANQFPRVFIFQHQEFDCQGASIKALIDLVETEVFAYCHADVYLPLGFFDNLFAFDFRNKWVESSRHHLIVKEEPAEQYFLNSRSYSGVQIGDSALLKSSVRHLEDDYIQRNEDIIIRELVEESGGQYEKTLSLMHLHQSPFMRGFGKPAYQDSEWAARIYNMQVRGIVKYLPAPVAKDNDYLIHEVWQSIFQLVKLGVFDTREFLAWVKSTNPSWLPLLTPRKIFYARLRVIFAEVYRRIGYSIRILVNGQ